MANKKTPERESGPKHKLTPKRSPDRKGAAGRHPSDGPEPKDPKRVRSGDGPQPARPPFLLPEGLRLEDLLSASLQGLWMVDSEGRTTYASERMAAMLGYSVQEMMGRSYEEFADPGWLPQARERFANRPEGTRTVYEFLFRRKDGVPLWALVSAQGLVGADGHFLGALGMLTDLTDWRAAAQDLAESEARYRALFEQSPDGVLILDPATTRPMQFNETAHRQLGYTREEFAGLTVSDIDAIETPEETAEHIAATLRRGQADFETLQRTKTGEVRNVHVTVKVVQAGGRSLYHCVWRDITDRKRVEAALGQSQRQLRALTDHMNEGLMRVDADDRILYVNPRLCEMLGYAEEELLGQVGVDLLVPDEERATILGKNRKRAKGFSDRYRTRMRTKAGEILELEVSGSPVPATGNLPAGSIGIITDVTERVRLERDLERSGRLYTVLSDIGQLISAARTKEELFEEACRILVTTGGLKLAWIGGRDSRTGDMVPHARFGSMSDYLDRIRISSEDVPEGRGPTGRAFREGGAVFCNDFFAEASTGPWQDEARRAGIGSSAALAFTVSEAERAVLNVYADATNYFTEELQGLLARVVESLAVGAGSVVREAARREAEAALRESEERYRRLFEMGSDPLVLVDSAMGQILDVNEAALALYGYTRAEWLAMNHTDVSAEPDKTRRAALEGETHIPRRWHRKKDGTVFPVEISACHLMWKGRQVHLADIRDISDRLRYEEELREAERFAQGTLDGLPENVCVLDEWGTILAVNQNWRDFARDNGDFSGTCCEGANYLEVCRKSRGQDAQGAEEFAAGIESVLRGERDEFALEYPCPAPGMKRWFIGRVRRFPGSGAARVVVAHENITSRKLAELELADSEQRYRTFIDATSDLAFLKDGEGRYLISNAANNAFFGRREEEILGRSDDDLMPPDAAANCRASDEAVIESNRPMTGEERVAGRVYQATKFPVALPDGAVGVGAYIRDVTELKTVEEALLESEERHRLLLATSLDGILSTAPDGRIFSANPAACAMLGWTEEELRAGGRDLVIDATDPRLARALEERDRAGSFKGELTMVRKSGERFPAEISTSVYRNARGDELTSMVLRDVTERRRSEAALRESAWRLESHVNNSPLAAIEFDGEFRVTLWSPGAERIFGWRAEEILGKAIAEIRWVHEDDAARVAALNAEMLEGRKSSNIHRNRNYTKDGRVLSCVWHNSALYDAEGNLLSVMSLVDDVTEREANERALRESEERFRQVSESIMDVAYSCVTQPEGHYGIEWMTGATEAMLGLGVDQVKALGCWGHLVLEEDRTLFKEKVTGLSPGQEGVCDLRLKRPDGSTAWVASYCRCVEGAEGQGPLLYGALVDITARKSAEESSRQSEERFRILAETIDEAYWIADPRINEMVFISPAYEKIWGRTCESLYQDPKSFMDAIHPEDRELARHALLEFKEGEMLDIEYRIVRPDGEVRWIRDKGFPYRGAEGTPLLYVGTAQDITERKEAEITLRDSRARLDLALKSASMGTWYWDVRPNRRRFDGQACHLLGLAPATFSGSAEEFYASVHPDDRERVKAAMAKTLQEDAPYQPEYRAVWPDGSVHHIAASARLTRDGVGEPSMVFGIIWDITERRRAEEEIRRLNAELAVHLKQKTAELGATTGELDGFAHSVSHDLRAPLRGIDGWSQALLEDYGDRLDEKGRGYLETVRSEAKHMGVLVDGLLEISRASRADMAREPVDLADLAHQARSALQRSEGARTVEFIIPDAMEVDADPNLMRILVRNLLGNACKFTRSRERALIEMGSQEVDGERVFFVRDNGVGFDMAFAHKLFKPFQRLHPREQYPGVGIGLATVQRIVHRHGGRIWAEGRENDGATFFFTLGPALTPTLFAEEGPQSSS